ncbi:MAG TPA: inositol monophosphatase family protein [Thermodesulfovibrionales bacterium]|nr:inositol monophosphatase family protein [Thermodesulfovibrionales bacterium]
MLDGTKEFLDIAIKAARLAGQIIFSHLGKISKRDIGLKQASDFVTSVDRESEKIIIDTIKEYFPDHHFLAEEALKEFGKGKYRWIIDPLDGTTNYIHGYPVFSVSIALEFEGEIVLGVILDPLRNELFWTEKGTGAYLNCSSIEVSNINIRESLITTGFPFRSKEMIDPYLKLFKNIFLKVSDLRRAGSAALDLAYLACGRCDGFFELGLSPWDIAAGSLLIKEAGGVVTDFGGDNHYLMTGNIVAGNPEVHKEIVREVKNIFTGIIDR